MNKTSFLTGAGVGLGLMYLLDPERGARRRGLVRDKCIRMAHKTADALDCTLRDLGHRAQGASAIMQSMLTLTRADVTDEVLVRRVRSKLGRFVSHPHAVDVSAQDGRIRLSGPILAHEVNVLLDCVRRVPGVTEVDSQLEAHKEAGDVPALQGGTARPGQRPELMQEHWSPTMRLVMGALGGALASFGARRRDPVGITLGATGAALLARSATDLEFSKLVGIGAGRRSVDVQKTINIDLPD